MNRMTSPIRRAGFVASFLLFTTSVIGEPIRVIEPIEQATRSARAGSREKAVAPTVHVIVEFRRPAAWRISSNGTSDMRADAINARRLALQSRVDELRSDLARMEATKGSSHPEIEQRAQIEQTFSRVLYGASLHVRRESLAAIRALPYVESVHVERTFVALSEPTVPHGVATAVRSDAGARGKGMIIAVIDTGIDYTHPALGGGLGPGFKVIGGWDFVNRDADPLDDYGHGTHVAGIIAADGSGLLGVAPDVSLVAYKVLDSQGNGYESAIIAAIERTVDPDQDGDPSDHIDIVNMSLGTNSYGDDPASRAVENATAAGVLFCVAAGNGGNYGNIASPAFTPVALTVGAVDGHDETASFSSRGPSFDFAIKPEIVAPGVDILSTFPNGGVVALSGTSMATPYVAGVAALVKSIHQDWSPAQIKAALISTAVWLPQDIMDTGAGRADRARAMAVATLVEPAVVSFGQADTRQPVWNTSRTVTLHNTSTTPQTYTATITGQRAGVIVRVVPNAVTLPAGASKTVVIEISMTNSAVPAPREGSLSYGGQVIWSGGSVPIHVPWAFVKAAFVTIEVTGQDENPVYANVLGEGLKWTSDYFGEVLRRFWPLEKVDIVVVEDRFEGSRAVIVEQVDLEGAAMANFDMNSAQYAITTDTLDEKGQPLVARNRTCYERILLSFPGKKNLSFEQRPSAGFLLPIQFGRASSRVKFHVTTSCGDSGRNVLYAAMHEPFAGLEGNVTRTLRPEWLRQEVAFRAENSAEIGTTVALASTRFAGVEAEYYIEGGSPFVMRSTKSPLTILFTRSLSPETDLVARLERWKVCPTGGDCSALSGMTLYLSPDTVRADADVYLEVSPMAYELPLGTTLTFGDAPLWPRGGIAAYDTDWTAGADWCGPLAEFRSPETGNAKVTFHRADGTLVAEGRAALHGFGTLTPGRYRVTSTASNLPIAGVPGTATFTASAQVGNVDPLVPIFTSLRIVDEHDRQAARVGSHTNASLLFSATDSRLGDDHAYHLRVPPREDATLVEYRAHGTSDWHPLPALVTARQYQNNTFLDAGVGSVFRVDLSTVTDEAIGTFDLRVRIEDEAGNTAQMLLEPAFAVGPLVGKRPAVRH
jgi:subtilisin family serine protease